MFLQSYIDDYNKLQIVKRNKLEIDKCSNYEYQLLKKYSLTILEPPFDPTDDNLHQQFHDCMQFIIHYLSAMQPAKLILCSKKDLKHARCLKASELLMKAKELQNKPKTKTKTVKSTKTVEELIQSLSPEMLRELKKHLK